MQLRAANCTIKKLIHEDIYKFTWCFNESIINAWIMMASYVCIWACL